MMNTDRSDTVFERARKVIPGGVNSPVRAFKSVGRNPVFIARAKGCELVDIDGNRYVDYVGSWGPMILGHAHPDVTRALLNAVPSGTSYGAPTELEVNMAELICEMVPSIEVVRMVNSGTEATMSAVRLARAYTGRSRIIKFEGCYHGHADAFLIKAGSGALTFGVPDSPGVLPAVAEHTLTARYNSADSVKELVKKYSGEIAAIIIEPVVGNMGCVPPGPGFLQALRQICTDDGCLLIFDEVMTGFRLARGGAQELYGITPDLTTLGKIIGGGLPVGAYGGRREIMEMISPSGPVYQAGTLSGNPLAMSAGFQTLSILKTQPDFYRQLEACSAELEREMTGANTTAGAPVRINRVGSMFTLFFTDGAVTDYGSAVAADTKRFAVYFREMLARGIYFPPSQFEAAFVSAAHTSDDIGRTIDAHTAALQRAFS